MIPTKDREYVSNDEISILQEDISAWAYRLYEDNKSEQLNFELGSISPLLGIAAKLGELEKAKTVPNMTKAIGDMFLYICDYASREEIIISHIGYLRNNQTKNAGIIAVGKMMQSTLHYHRKIIGEDEHHLVTLVAINELLSYLNLFIEAQGWGISLISIFRDAWETIVTTGKIKKGRSKK